MSISKLKIKNFKCFKDWFSIDFSKDTNILVGNNGTGKSTILEAINLVLTGTYHGKSIRNEISHYLFNIEVVNEYLNSIKNGKLVEPPEIIIEAYFHDDIPEFLGNGNSEENNDVSGVKLSIVFDEKFKEEYSNFCKTLLKNKDNNDSIIHEFTSLPIEYYVVEWESFARQSITARSIKTKSAFIDTTNYTPISGSDIYISRIIKNLLDNNEIIEVSQAHRLMKNQFSVNPSISNINKKISQNTNKKLSISVDFGNKSAWETSLITNLDNIPYNNIGKGNQCIIKSQLALSSIKEKENNDIILIEEPECHLSHTNLNGLLDIIDQAKEDKQIIITTHSSFVANKLGLDNLILLSQGNILRLKDLTKDTYQYFKKVSGFDTLRLILASKVILVEGPSDELILQRAYIDNFHGKLPIKNGIDIISVGISFKRFLEIARKLNIKVNVVTDNDGNIEDLETKYEDYLKENASPNINIYYDEKVHAYKGELKKYNYNTLEPCLFRANSLKVLNKVLNQNYKTDDELLKYMKKNKTEVALAIFESEQKIEYPEYIKKAIQI